MGPSGNDGKSLLPFIFSLFSPSFLTIVTVLAFTGDLQRFTIIVPGDPYFATGTRSLADGGLTRIGVGGVGPVGSAIDQNDDRWIYSQVSPSSLRGYVITMSGSFGSSFVASTNPSWISRKSSSFLVSDSWDSILTFFFLLSALGQVKINYCGTEVYVLDGLGSTPRVNIFSKNGATLLYDTSYSVTGASSITLSPEAQYMYRVFSSLLPSFS